MMKVNFPAIVRQPADLSAAIQSRRKDIGMTLGDLEFRSGIQDGYAAKLEKPDGTRHRPIAYTSPSPFNEAPARALLAAIQSGNAAQINRAASWLSASLEKQKPGGPRLNLMGSYVLEALGLALVVMPADQAERLLAASKSGDIAIKREPNGRHKHLEHTRRRTASVSFSIVQSSKPSARITT